MSLIDIAGSQYGGGAGRFREQLFREGWGDYAIGASNGLTLKWLAQREHVARGASRVVAANNASFFLAGSERWTLARNANHFLTEDEIKRTWKMLPKSFKYQVQVVRRSLRRSDVIIAPSASMAERVAHHLPSLADRIVIRYHPLKAPSRSSITKPVILCPIVNSPYKSLAKRLVLLQDALRDRFDLTVICTAEAQSMPQRLLEDKRFRFVGLLDRDRLADIYSTSRAIFYPTDVESFGYPLAEARASGTPVLALNTFHNRDVAAGALCGYDEDNAESLAGAIHRAQTAHFVPDPEPFNPAKFFRWLLHD